MFSDNDIRVLIVVFMVAAYGWVLLYKKGSAAAKNLNPEIKDAAKRAATRKAISLIEKWLK